MVIFEVAKNILDVPVFLRLNVLCAFRSLRGEMSKKNKKSTQRNRHAFDLQRESSD